ncbi:MAG: hypothetical protein ABIK47_06645 [candidate division WOR-3 bacterium]
MPLDRGLPYPCRRLVEITKAWGGRLYLVGGMVRDWLLHNSNLALSCDWDFAVDLRSTGRSLIQLLKQLHRETGAKYISYPQFLTGSLYLPGLRIDISHTRDESYPCPAVLPKVKVAGIEADLRRRDFTINAMAIELTGSHGDGIIDPYGGQDDLRRRVLRVLYPESFIDDPTRIFRALRFGIRLEFEIESGTLYLLRQAVKEGYLALLTPERVLYELRCISKEARAFKVMEAVVKEGVLAAFFHFSPPRRFLTDLKRLTQAGIREDPIFLYLLSILPLDNRFPITKEERQVSEAIKTFSNLENRLRRARRRSTIYRLLKPLPLPALRLLAVLKTGPVAKKLSLFLNELTFVKPELKAGDLLLLGIRPGPQLGKIIERVLYARLNGRVRNKDEERALAERWLSHNV